MTWEHENLKTDTNTYYNYEVCEAGNPLVLDNGLFTMLLRDYIMVLKREVRVYFWKQWL